MIHQLSDCICAGIVAATTDAHAANAVVVVVVLYITTTVFFSLVHFENNPRERAIEQCILVCMYCLQRTKLLGSTIQPIR